MALLTRQEMRRVPVVDEPAEAQFGVVEIDLDLCGGCKMCTLVCPCNVLEMFGETRIKKARVKESFTMCLACDNCHAICESGAISLVRPYDFVGRYKQLSRGALSQPRAF